MGWPQVWIRAVLKSGQRKPLEPSKLDLRKYDFKEKHEQWTGKSMRIKNLSVGSC